MVNGEHIYEPKYYAAGSTEPMTVIFYDKPTEGLDIEDENVFNFLYIVVATDEQTGHQVMLRIRNDATMKQITDQLAYLVKSEGGTVSNE